ncbi:MAG: glycosyltransferase [Acidobacteriia bacterium]|nr:glycosyltransferase [Terriglobia bacterium]
MAESKQGRVSVIIPARNEEANIARVVSSLAAQEGLREILVVDDHSEDRTAQILESLQAKIPNLRVMRTNSLPAGWTGKTYAAATGAHAASGDWLLFTDADTEHMPGSLAALLERAEREGADLLSLSPGQSTDTVWEKCVIPLVYAHLARLYRFRDVSDPASPAAAANGQYVLIRRSAYERAGGHEAVRGAILEDVELARRVKSAGDRLLFLPGSQWVITRMYGSFSEMWRGWTKNLYLLYGRNVTRMLATLAELWLLDLLPALAFLGLALAWALGVAADWTLLAAMAFFLLAVWRQWTYSQALGRIGFDPGLAAYQTTGAAILGLLLLNSARAYRLGGKVQWKGRVYSTEGRK